MQEVAEVGRVRMNSDQPSPDHANVTSKFQGSLYTFCRFCTSLLGPIQNQLPVGDVQLGNIGSSESCRNLAHPATVPTSYGLAPFAHAVWRGGLFVHLRIRP